MSTQILAINRANLDDFCFQLPNPIIAKPIILPKRGRGLELQLDCGDVLATVCENGSPAKFCSIDEVLLELDGIENLDASAIQLNTSKFWEN